MQYMPNISHAFSFLIEQCQQYQNMLFCLAVVAILVLLRYFAGFFNPISSHKNIWFSGALLGCSLVALLFYNDAWPQPLQSSIQIVGVSAFIFSTVVAIIAFARLIRFAIIGTLWLLITVMVGEKLATLPIGDQLGLRKLVQVTNNIKEEENVSELLKVISFNQVDPPV